MDNLLTTKNVTTATLVLLNSLHTTFVLSEEIEKNLVQGRVDIAHENIKRLEIAISDVEEKNGNLSALDTLNERVAVLRDVLAVETEKIWTTKFVTFSEEGDIQLSISRTSEGIMPLFEVNAIRIRAIDGHFNISTTFEVIVFIGF
jgi:hypothetical protein